MKVILSYGSYFNHGKKYQIKFSYENQKEIENIRELMEQLKSTNTFNYYYLDGNGNISLKKTDIYGGTDIPKDILHPFISMLLAIKNTTIIIGTKEITSYELNTFNQAVDTLHINATLSKGIYFSSNQTYYIVFKYANDEQRAEILYDFNTRLNLHAGPNSARALEGKEHIMPYLVDRTGDITAKNASIIGGTNIPEDLLKDYIKSFIEEHDMIINIGNQQFREKFDEVKFEEALSYIVPGRARIRHKETI